MIETLWIGVCAAVIGVAFVTVQPGLFVWWFRFLLWIEPYTGEWITKPLGLCPQCFAGQVALWWSVIAYGPTWDAIVSACIAIVITPGLVRAYEWSK